MAEEKTKIEEEQVNLVIARLKTMSEHIRVHMGNGQAFDRDTLIAEIKNGTDLGKEMVKAEMEYLRILKNI